MSVGSSSFSTMHLSHASSSSSSRQNNAPASTGSKTSLEVITGAIFNKAEQAYNAIERLRVSPTYKKCKVDDILFYSFSAITAYHSPIVFTVTALWGCAIKSLFHKNLTGRDRKDIDEAVNFVNNKKVYFAGSCALITAAASKIGFVPLRYLARSPFSFVGGLVLGIHLATQFKSIEDKANTISVSILKAIGANNINYWK